MENITSPECREVFSFRKNKFVCSIRNGANSSLRSESVEIYIKKYFYINFVYICIVKHKMKNTMSLVATCLFIPIRLPNLSFGICFTCFAIFTTLLLYIILLVKQAFVYNRLIITPPPFTIKQSRFIWEVITFIEGVPSNH